MNATSAIPAGAESLRNPIESICERYGLTRRELAVALGCSYDIVWAHATGRFPKLRPQLQHALNTAGFDGDSVAREYSRWVVEQSAAHRSCFHSTCGETAVKK